MHVDGSNNDKNADVIARLQDYSRSRQFQAAKSAPEGEEPTSAPATTSSTESTSENNVPGSVRLLDEGHFKGVPALRISINFAEEIKAIDAVRSQESLEAGIETLASETTATIDAFVADTELTPEQESQLASARTAFDDAVAGIVAGNDGLSADTEVFGELRTAFQDFLNSLVPPREESESDTVIPVDFSEDGEPVEETEATQGSSPLEAGSSGADEAATSDVFAGLRESLSDIFESTISGLEESLATINQREIPAPEGNGRAYERFLATYNEIFGIGTGDESATETEHLNTVT